MQNLPRTRQNIQPASLPQGAVGTRLQAEKVTGILLPYSLFALVISPVTRLAFRPAPPFAARP